MKTNAVIESILSRRSIRSFKSTPLAHEDLEAIVRCGQWAPSARNQQEWTFVVLESSEQVASLAKIMASALGNETYNMYMPQAAIIVAHKKAADFARQDDGCALQNMFLAAQSLGIGSVWINQLNGICDCVEVRAKLDSLGVPSNFEVFGICALGYAEAQPDAPVRKSTVIWA